ncbi:ABC transporter ATP-binding protein [Flaviflagellibacter deserti]|uniref:ABC transporter ATP-binding protein n=1 Tax=Flaviflagellibacter deserti TaxID=2267266 RepID=A0ABV9Z2Z9_9HYPH
MALLKRLLREEGRQYAPRYVLALALMGVVAAATGASAWIIQSVVNDIFINKNAAMIWVVATSVLAIYLAKGVADYYRAKVMNRIGTDIISSQQKRLYAHLLDQGMDYFNSASIGDVVTRVSGNALAIRRALDLIVTSFGKDFLSLVSLVTVMVIQDPWLSLVSLVIMPAAVLGVTSLVKRTRKIAGQEYQTQSRIVDTLKETILGITVVKSFGMEPRMRVDMNSAIDRSAWQSLKIANLGARTSPLMESLAGVAVAVIVIYGGYGVIHLGRDAGSLFSFLAALLLAYEPAKRLAKLQVQMESTLVGVSMMYDFLDTPSTLVDHPQAAPLHLVQGQVAFDAVGFHYGNTPALRNLSLVFPAGRVSALVGASGAGKSTIFSLIERFHDPSSGQVLIDGQDLRGVTLQSLRASIAYVTQDPFLFDGTIRDNILAGRPGATEREMIAAAEAANAHDFIVGFPDGYDHPVGEGGGNLSGGQRQRVAIARAMLRDAPILLLDEATSALDAESEAKVKSALDRLMSGRTTIVIAHRLSTVRNADVIHVLDRGRLVESGTHDQLVAHNGVYARLAALQFATQPARRPRRAATAPVV